MSYNDFVKTAKDHENFQGEYINQQLKTQNKEFQISYSELKKQYELQFASLEKKKTVIEKLMSDFYAVASANAVTKQYLEDVFKKNNFDPTGS